MSRQRFGEGLPFSASAIALAKSCRSASRASSTRAIVDQRKSRCPFSACERAAALVPARVATSCCAIPARPRRMSSARPRVRDSRAIRFVRSESMGSLADPGCLSISTNCARLPRTNNKCPRAATNSRGRGTERTSSRRVDSLPTIDGLPLSSNRSLGASNKGGTEMSPTVEIPDSLVLAAIERAALHRADGEPAMPVWAITEHLGIPRRSRNVRAQIAALEASGATERSRRHGIAMWSLTSAGKRRLTRARRGGEIELPESPQHAKWRNTRTLAAQEIERCHEAARDAVEAATGMLDAPVSSGPRFGRSSRSWIGLDWVRFRGFGQQNAAAAQTSDRETASSVRRRPLI